MAYIKKTIRNLEVFRGKFDQSIQDFLPERGHWREIIEQGQSVICKSHLDPRQGDKYILPGEQVIVVKYEGSPQDGRPHWAVYFYCCESCLERHKLIAHLLPPKPTPAS